MALARRAVSKAETVIVTTIAIATAMVIVAVVLIEAIAVVVVYVFMEMIIRTEVVVITMVKVVVFAGRQEQITMIAVPRISALVVVMTGMIRRALATATAASALTPSATPASIAAVTGREEVFSR